MTPIDTLMRQEIERVGPIGVDRYMELALAHPEHGYYRTRDPLGVPGDFTTAPEISQIFGEILGLWLADRWLAMGRPDPVALVELGPGRGTLMADLLRALTVLPELRRAVRVRLVETSPALRARQRAVLAERHPEQTIVWHERIEDLPPGPTLLVANEFFDALPIRQFVRRADGWRERLIDLGSNGGLAWIESAAAVGIVVPVEAEPDEGDVVEISEPSRMIARLIGERLAAAPGAALIVDYGHGRSGFGDTFQAVRHHRPVSVFDAPGEADLTAHVDFQALGSAIEEGGGIVAGLEGQGRFLMANGASVREAALTRRATPEEAIDIRRAIARLIDPNQMGSLFKVLAALSPGTPTPEGFRRWS